MQRKEQHRATLNDILITEELSQRAPRSPSWRSQAQAMQSLAREMASDSQTLLQSLVDICVDLCYAGSAGVSLIETTPSEEEVFRAHVLAGALANDVGVTTPRDFSPDGVTLERGTPQLFSHPEWYFTYFQASNTPIIEELVLPVIGDRHVFGTIWIMSHDEGQHFDSEDVRIMTSLADFTATALLLQQRQTGELPTACVETQMVESKQALEQFLSFRTLHEPTASLTRALISNLLGRAAFVVDRNLRYLLAEGEALAMPAAGCAYAGFTREDFVGRTIFEVLPPELAANYEPMYRKALAGEQFEHEHNAHDRLYISLFTPLSSANGEVEAVLVVSDDITERRQALSAADADIEDMQRLHELSVRLVALDDIQTLYQEIVATAIALTRADAGSVQILDKATQDLVLLATQGIMPEMIEHFRRLNASSNTSCGRALLTGERTFVDFDVPESEDPDGSMRMHFDAGFLSVQSTPLISRSGKVIGMVSTHWRKHHRPSDRELRFLDLLARQAADIIEQRLAHVALRQSEEKFRAFVSVAASDIISDIIYEMSADWREMRSLKGKAFIPTTENPRHDWMEAYIPETDKPQVWAAINRAIATRSNYELEHRVIRLDGTVGWTFSRAIPLINEMGEIVKWFGAASDITEQKQAELDRIRLIQEQAAHEKERQRAETLAELDRAKTLFFSNVSHEFRTPLTLSLAPLQDALSDSANPLPPAQRERIELAHRNSLRLLKLVNTLLDFSRIEAGRMEAVYEPTDLALYTTELASVFRSAIERAGLRLIVDCPPLAKPVYVDREMWEKIVLNLLSNALKFTLVGEIAIRLHLRADDYHVRLQVEDTGIGIEAEELPHLMKRFYQVKRATARTHEGFGIGLALVHELSKMHGGTVEVSSTVGQGSCFTVTIPLGTAHLPSVNVSARRLRQVVGEHTQATRALASTAPHAAPDVQKTDLWIGEKDARTRGRGDTVNVCDKSSASPHILIVDDNADMRDYLKRILSEHVEVHAVANGVEALAAVNEQLPDLILTDVMMPCLDGFELLQALRASAWTKDVPIILLSARAGEESVIEGLLAGADDYLIKPFSATELVTRINTYLKMSQKRSEALRFERAINRKKDEVLSTVSHELNTPLVAILGWTRLLRSNPPSPAMLTNALEIIERNAIRQVKLVQDLLNISRISAGKIYLDLQPVELQGVIEQAIATISPSLETKDIRLDCLLDPLPIIVQGDPERLQQIVLNLLTNAAKFTPQQGRIRISLLPHENQAQIVITDTGCGIDAEFLPYIFDTFSQAPETKKGLGLGLAIARSLIELHSGTIIAQSLGVGQGATFILTLPIPLV